MKDEEAYFTFWSSPTSEETMHKNLHLLKVMGNSEIMQNDHLPLEEIKKFENKIRAFHGINADDALESGSSSEQEQSKAVEDEDMIFTFDTFI